MNENVRVIIIIFYFEQSKESISIFMLCHCLLFLLFKEYIFKTLNSLRKLRVI